MEQLNVRLRKFLKKLKSEKSGFYKLTRPRKTTDAQPKNTDRNRYDETNEIFGFAVFCNVEIFHDNVPLFDGVTTLIHSSCQTRFRD